MGAELVLAQTLSSQFRIDNPDDVIVLQCHDEDEQDYCANNSHMVGCDDALRDMFSNLALWDELTGSYDVWSNTDKARVNDMIAQWLGIPVEVAAMCSQRNARRAGEHINFPAKFSSARYMAATKPDKPQGEGSFWWSLHNRTQWKKSHCTWRCAA